MAGVKNSPLKEFHIEMGAKMVPRFNWNLPLHFSEGTVEEHLWCRSRCAMFDICSDGKFRIAFPGAAAALEKFLFFKSSTLAPGSCRRDIMTGTDGSIIAGVRIAVMAEDDIFLAVSLPGVNNCLQLLQKEKIAFSDLSEYLAGIGLHGPQAAEVLSLCGMDVNELPGVQQSKLLELDGLRVIMTGSDITGTPGYDIFFNAGCADQIWDLFLDTDIPRPAGIAAMESLRLEHGVWENGAELTPLRKAADLEAHLGLIFFDTRQFPLPGTELPATEDHGEATVLAGAFVPTLKKSAVSVWFTGAVTSADSRQ